MRMWTVAGNVIGLLTLVSCGDDDDGVERWRCQQRSATECGCLVSARTKPDSIPMCAVSACCVHYVDVHTFCDCWTGESGAALTEAECEGQIQRLGVMTSRVSMCPPP